MDKELVTITIPTYNSGKTLKLCLDAIKKQTYKKIEINIVDGKSSDNTIKVAKKFGVKKIKILPGSLLEARYEGVKMANGLYTLILDSDQILSKNTIERSVEKFKKEKLDMLVLEESVYECNSFLENLFQLDRKLINKVNNLDPFTGVIMPRFFKTNVLKKAYSNIPAKMFPRTGGPDHAIVYYETWKLTKKIGVVSNAVYHMEPKSLGHLWKKFYRWGYTSVDAHYGKYGNLMNRKERFRTGLFTDGMIIESLGSIMLLLLKGIAFKTGFYFAKLKRNMVNK